MSITYPYTDEQWAAGVPVELTRQTFLIEQYLGRTIEQGECLADIENEIYWVQSRQDDDRAVHIDWTRKRVHLCPWSDL